jgi:putative ABC transport system permease protein
LRVLSGLRYIYEARFGARASLIQEGFAVLGIAVGVALLFASQVSSTSLDHAVAQLNSQLVGRAQVQLKARGYEGVSDRLLEQVRSAPGVSRAYPLLERQTNLIGPYGERPIDLIGTEPSALSGSPLLRRFSPAQLASVRSSALPIIALPSPLASEVGARASGHVQLQVGARLVSTLVGATLAEEDIGGLEHSPVAITSLLYARRLTGAPGRLTRIFIRYEPQQSRTALAALAALARAWNVNLQPSTFESRVFAVAVAPQNSSEQLFSGISAFVGLMFALNAMLITVPSRRKLIEDMLPHGAAPTVIVLLVDAAVLGILACVLGLLLGDLLSVVVFNSTPGYLTFAFPIGNSRIVTWQAVALAVAVGMVAAAAGVLWPAREIIWGSRESAATRSQHRRSWSAARVLIGLALLAVTTFGLPSNTTTAVIGNITLVLALLCLLPFLFDAAVAVFARLSNVFDVHGAGLAASELDTPQTRVRYLAIAATAALAVYGTSEFGGIQANLTRGLGSSIRGMDSSANLWVVPSGEYSLQTTVPFQPVDARRLASLPGVRQLSVYRGSFLDWGDHRIWVIAPAPSIEQPIPPTQIQRGTLAAARARVRSGGWVVLSKGIAAEHHLQIGDSFELPSPRPATFRLAGVSSNLGWPPGAMIMNSADYAQAWGSTSPSAYQIQTTAGISPAAERLVVRRALAGVGLSVQTSAEREQLHYAAAAQGLSRLTQIRILILLAAILAVVGSMGALIWSRREQIAAMKCHGIEEGELWRSLLYESGVMLAAGCSIGALFSMYAQVLGSHTLATVTGFPIVFDIQGTAAVTSFALVIVITLAVLAIVGGLVVRVSPSTVSPAY